MTHLLSILAANINTTASTNTQAAETGFFAGAFAFLLLPSVFYLVLTVVVIILITLHENEKIGWSHTVFILLVAYFCFKFNLGFSDLIHNPLPLLKWVGIYLGAGIVWSFCKWYFYLRNVFVKFNEKKQKYFSEYSTENLPETLSKGERDKILKEKVNYRLKEYYDRDDKMIRIIKSNIIETIKFEKIQNSAKTNKLIHTDEITIHKYEIVNPQANNNKALITTWITHWPISLVWTLINDPIKKLINHIFDFIKSAFQSISDKMFKSLKADL